MHMRVLSERKFLVEAMLFTLAQCLSMDVIASSLSQRCLIDVMPQDPQVRAHAVWPAGARCFSDFFALRLAEARG